MQRDERYTILRMMKVIVFLRKENPLKKNCHFFHKRAGLIALIIVGFGSKYYIYESLKKV